MKFAIFGQTIISVISVCDYVPPKSFHLKKGWYRDPSGSPNRFSEFHITALSETKESSKLLTNIVVKFNIAALRIASGLLIDAQLKIKPSQYLHYFL